jgi:hypothetical protein
MIRRHGDGALDIDFYRRRAALMRVGERTRLTYVLLLAAGTTACAGIGYCRSVLRSRCQPTVASGLASTDAK